MHHQNKNIYCHLFLLIQLISLSYSAYAKYKLNDHFYFDPITESACNHINYWTPFYTNTTCYRWVNLNPNDTTSLSTITIMLDHNMFKDTFDNINKQIKVLKAKWIRYTGNITVPNEEIIFNLMGFTVKPTPEAPSTPGYRIGELVMNNYIINNGTKTDEGGYWTNKEYNSTFAYSYTTTGNNAIINKSSKIGIRPVLVIQKNLLKVIPAAININTLIENAKLYKYKWENKTYGDQYYKQLQAFTVTKDRLIYSSSNSKNPDYCVLYSYKGTNYSTLSAKKYDKCGHANGITYNTKLDKIEVCGAVSYSQVNQYDPYNLTFEAAYSKKNSYPGFSGIGYNENRNFYVGLSGKNIFYSLTTGTWPIKYSFNYPCFETTQDIEFHDGYIFMPVYDAGEKGKYQIYSMWGKGNSLVYVYKAKFNTDGTPGRNFGRLIARLLIEQKGELESISFRNEKAYFGFAVQGLDPTYTFKFYEMSYEELKNKFAPSNEEEERLIFLGEK